MAKLNRTLGLPETIFFGIGSILGGGVKAGNSGIYPDSEEHSQKLSTSTYQILSPIK